jgi:hypothetical protein
VAHGYLYHRSQLSYQEWPVGTYTTCPSSSISSGQWVLTARFRSGISSGQWVLIQQVSACVSKVASGYLHHRSQMRYQQWPVSTYTTGPSSSISSGQWVLIPQVSAWVSTVASGHLHHRSQLRCQQWPMSTYSKHFRSGISSGQWVLTAHLRLGIGSEDGDGKDLQNVKNTA